MTATRDAHTRPRSGAVVWIDEHQAIITTATPDGEPIVEQLGRGPMESESAFDARAVVALRDLDPVAVSGPAFSRVAFERAFTSVTHRPERLLDVEPDTDVPETV